LKYQLLNIFYDHDQEIEWLTSYVDQENEILQSGTKKEYWEWLKEQKQEFQEFCENNVAEASRLKKREYAHLNKL